MRIEPRTYWPRLSDLSRRHQCIQLDEWPCFKLIFIQSSSSLSTLLISILFLFLTLPFLLMERSGFNWTSSLKTIAARVTFHLLWAPKRQQYAHMLTYLECAQSPLCNGVKIFLMRHDEGIAPFYCNILEKKKLFSFFFSLTPLFQPPLREQNTHFVLSSSFQQILRVKN